MRFTAHSGGMSHEHPHPRRRRALGHRVRHAIRPHSHDHGTDAALEGSADGWRALWVSLAGLAVTAGAQAVVVALSGSVALLGDTLHNAADALTAVPLGVAFLLGRRRPTRRYTYGYGRAEDLAGIAIVLTIAASSALTAYEAVYRLLHPRDITDLWAVAIAAVQRLLHPRPVSHLAAVAVAAAIGFAGNELVARYRIRTGRRIGSAALVADGLHARADGFTSLAVLAGAGGVALGWGWADAAAGLLISLAIAMALRQAAGEVFGRMMDAVDPALVARAEAALRGTPGVLGVGQVRLRWIGHTLRAECEVIVDGTATVVEAHQVAVEAEHALMHALPRLGGALVHADPQPCDGVDHHAGSVLHR